MYNSMSCLISLLVTIVIVTTSGCCHGRYGNDQLTAAQNHAKSLYAEQQNLQLQNQQMMMAMESDKQMLMQHLTDMESQLAAANDRVQNLIAERGELTDRFAKSVTDDGSILVNSIPSNLQSEGFHYDPATGLHKFHSDILFDLGSDRLRPESDPILAEFSRSVTSGAASAMRVLIVGHTDDQRIARHETMQKHATNWHLSTDRAAAVVLALGNLGVGPDRMAAMGYSEFQPLENSKEETSRQRNRRVELYIVPSEGNLARWDPAAAVR